MIRDSRVGRSVYTFVYGAEKLRLNRGRANAEKILHSGTNDVSLGPSLELGSRSRSKIYSPELHAGRVVSPPKITSVRTGGVPFSGSFIGSPNGAAGELTGCLRGKLCST